MVDISIALLEFSYGGDGLLSFRFLLQMMSIVQGMMRGGQEVSFFISIFLIIPRLILLLEIISVSLSSYHWFVSYIPRRHVIYIYSSSMAALLLFDRSKVKGG